MTENELSHEIIGSAIDVHRTLGPGLLESAYEECLYYELKQKKFQTLFYLLEKNTLIKIYPKIK